MSALLEQARRACRDLGGPEVDLWSLPPRIAARAEASGRPVEVVARDVVSGWLFGRATTGDPDARARIVELWSADVSRWCRWNAAPGSDPRDAAQEVLIRALSHGRPLPEPDGFRSWLWAVAWRVLRETERKDWLGRWFRGPAPDTASDEVPADEALMDAERAALVRRVLGELPLEERAALWMAYVEGLSRAEIAELTGWPIGTVNRRLAAARASFAGRAARVGLQPWPGAAAEAGR
jgi:RNA polymerase sigma factor (sigma-70 family)